MSKKCGISGMWPILLLILTWSSAQEKDKICTKPENSGRNSREYSTSHIYYDNRDATVDIRKWPWLVSIGVNDVRGKYTQACAGVVITEDHILTTAFCLDFLQNDPHGPQITSLEDVIIHAGDGNLKFSGGDNKTVQVKSYKDSRIHKKYNYTFHYYDVAVIELQQSLDLSTEFVRSVYLPTPEESAFITKSKDTDILLVISGWQNGKPKDGYITSFPDEYCIGHYHGTWLNQTIGFSDDVMCGGNTATLERVCIGNEGSPIVRYNETQNRYILVGLLSTQNIQESCKPYSNQSILRNNIFTRIASMNIITFIYEEICNYKSKKLGGAKAPYKFKKESHIYLEDCGVNNAVIAMKQNKTTDHHIWPWQVSIGYRKNGRWRHFCGGVIITTTKIITAVHCLSDHKIVYKEEVFVRMGDFHLDNPRDDFDGVEEHRILTFRIHFNYTNSRNFDVAALEFEKTPLTFSENIKPICSSTIKEAKSKNEEDGIPLITVGWGEDERKTYGNELKETFVATYEESYCNKTYKDTSIKLTEELICAGDISGYSGTCYGDSGGASVHFNALEERYFLQAIVSGSPKSRCGTSEYPNTYVRMTHKGILTWLWKDIWIGGPDIIRKYQNVEYICHSSNKQRQQIVWRVNDEQGELFQRGNNKMINFTVTNTTTSFKIITIECTDFSSDPPDRVTKIVEIVEPSDESSAQAEIIIISFSIFLFGIFSILIFKYWIQLKGHCKACVGERESINDFDLDETISPIDEEEELIDIENRNNSENMSVPISGPKNIEEEPPVKELTDKRSLKCSKCGYAITGGVLHSDEGAYLHPECLRCGTCGKILQSNSYHISNLGIPLCYTHYIDELDKCCRCGKPLVQSYVSNSKGENYHKECLEKYIERCSKCGKLLKGTYFSNSKGQNYHEECLVCTKCGVVLTGTYKTDKEENPLCQTHYMDQFPKCLKCAKPIMEKQRVDELGGIYHPECFICSTCGVILNSSYYADKQNLPLCQKDYLDTLQKCNICREPLIGRYKENADGEGFHAGCISNSTPLT